MVKLSPPFRDDYMSFRLESLKTAQQAEQQAFDALDSSIQTEFAPIIKHFKDLALDWLKKADQEIALACHPDSCADHYLPALESLSECTNSISRMRKLRKILGL